MSSHAITRAMERYGLDLTTQDLQQIAARIAAGDDEGSRKILTRLPSGGS